MRLGKSFPMGSCSTCGDENSLRYGLGLTTVTATSALSRETPTKETPEMAEKHIEKRLKRLWVRMGETLKQRRGTSVGRWWMTWVSGARWWVLGSSKAASVACSAVFDADTVREL